MREAYSQDGRRTRVTKGVSWAQAPSLRSPQREYVFLAPEMGVTAPSGEQRSHAATHGQIHEHHR